MKMFRPALAGVLPAFVLLVCVQLDVRAASTPLPPETQSWFTGDDTVKNHIWQPTGPLSSGATYATATVAARSQSRQLCFEDRVAHQRAIEEVYWRHRIWPKNRPDPKPSLGAMLLNEFLKEHRKLESLEKAVAKQRKENATMRAMLKEQAEQIQKVTAHVEVSSSVRAPQMVNNNR